VEGVSRLIVGRAWVLVELDRMAVVVGTRRINPLMMGDQSTVPGKIHDKESGRFHKTIQIPG